MSKGLYVRTKEGIYENKPLEKHLGKRKGNGFEIVFKEQDIIKQADTIEELCDVEVIVWNDSTPSTWNKFLTKQEFERLYSSFQRKNVIACYGAIWTDKGLIYVAKMNEKGELELL